MKDPVSLLNGALEGRYRIERELGQGGMATVYLADDLRHERKVAFKVLKPELAAVVGAERFLAEIKTTANLQHPHILPLFDSGTADSFLFYVMPFVEGETLQDRLQREKQLPIGEAVRIATDVADALDAAHEQGVIHRDIKPANILLSRGRPLVADFGIALAVTTAGGGRLTETGLSMGTPYYMSPEQASADRDPSAASDVYSLGCVLYEMLVGDPPFTGGSAQAVLAKILTGDVPTPTAARPSIPPNVDATIRKALERLPADRFPSAKEFGRALADDGFRHGAVATSGSGALSGVSLPVWRRAAPWGLSAVLAAVLLTRSTAAPTERVRRADLVLPDSARLEFVGQTPLGVGLPALALSPDGSQVAYVARGPSSVQLYVRRLDELDVTALPGTEGAYAPFFSPDGEWVGFFSGAELKKVRVTGGAPLTLAQLQLPYGGAWSPDDRILVSVQEGEQLVWVPAGGGSPESIVGADGVLPQFLGSHEWVITGGGGQPLWITSLETGEWFGIDRQGLVPASEAADASDLIYGSNPRYLASGHILYMSGDGVVFALPFDAAKREVLGPPEAVLDGVRQEGVWGAGQLAVADDGTLVYARGENAGLTRVVWRDRSGAVDTLLAFPAAQYGALDLAPDGRRLIVRVLPVAGPAEVWHLDLVQGVRSVLSDLPRRGVQWWPDGRRLAFGVSDPPATVLLDAANPRLQDTIPGWTLLETAADGTLLIDTPSGLAIRTADAPDAPPRTLDTEFDGWGATVSAGGRWIGFTSNVTEEAGFEIYLLRAEPPYDRFHVSPGGGEEPVWSPDGDLVYREGQRWMAVTPPVSRNDRPGPPRVLFEGPYQNVLGRSHDIGPDGRHLLLAEPSRGSTSQLVLVTNFFEEVGRLAPSR
jgi:serine/threonine-protein kinase